MQPELPTIDVRDLFGEERRALLGLLDGLDPDQWQLPTVCPGWSVADVALHILWTDISYLSRQRDHYSGPPNELERDLSDWATLVAFINELNENWIRGARRMSPQLIRTFLSATGDELAAFQRSRELTAPGVPVDWAGDGPAPLWLDVAREYTERWVHQQHIRDAVGMPGLTDHRMFGPVLDTFARALPHALRDQDRDEGTSVRLTITGEAGGTWTAQRVQDRWTLVADASSPADATVEITQALAWRLFTKGVRPDDARTESRVAGDPVLADAVLTMVTILA